MKTCNKCSEERDEKKDYYNSDNTCKVCRRRISRENENKNRESPEWCKKEKERHREKYYRLGYKEKHKPTPEKQKEGMKRYKDKFPEKILAKNSSQRINTPKGKEKHHWSYNKEHYRSIFIMTIENHNKYHRYITYDQERMMYRRCDTNVLLDTAESNLQYLRELRIENDYCNYEKTIKALDGFIN